MVVNEVYFYMDNFTWFSKNLDKFQRSLDPIEDYMKKEASSRKGLIFVKRTEMQRAPAAVKTVLKEL